MEKIAIDIVLLPPEKIIDLSLSINKESIKRDKERFVMGKEYIVPHISLTLMSVYTKNLDMIIDQVKRIKYPPLKLSLKSIGYYERGDGKRSFFELDITEELRNLHKIILDKLGDQIQTCDKETEFIDSDFKDVSSTTIEIINNYKDRYAYDKYNPHITLCCFDAHEYTEIDFPIDFSSDTIAVFQLGDGGTCRKLLFSNRLY